MRMFHERLPSEWEIYLQPHLNGLRPDFVLLNPKVGIAVFEVKDWDLGAMRYFTQADEWGVTALWAEKDGKSFSVQNSNPVTKVNLYKKEIFELYCPRLRHGAGWAAITAGVIFPFARKNQVRNLLSPFLRSDESDAYGRYQPISGMDEVTSGNIEAVFPEVSRKSSALMSEDLARDLRGWLVEPDFSSAQREPLELDRNQLSLAQTRTESGYRRIKGPAGSGKSLVLCARAARLAKEGQSVLVANYNITLWHYLRDLIVRDLTEPRQLRNVQLTHFHLWCKHACYDVGWGHRYDDLWKEGDSEGGLDQILNVDLPLLVAEAITRPGTRLYDAILVDEGQDYSPLWWNVLRKVCKPNGEMLLVADATQDIYGKARSWTDEAMKGAGFPGGRWAELKVSYRLPPAALRLARDFAETYLPEETVDLPEPDQGSLDLFPCKLRWVQCDTLNPDQLCSDEIRQLMHKTGERGLANADITLLVSTMSAGSAVVECLAADHIKAVDTFGVDHRRKKMGFFMGDGRIKATTLHSFKGWESRLLVLYVTDAVHAESLALIYAGLTRLKRSTQGSWLTVVCAAPQLREFGKKFDDYVAV